MLLEPEDTSRHCLEGHALHEFALLVQFRFFPGHVVAWDEMPDPQLTWSLLFDSTGGHGHLSSGCFGLHLVRGIRAFRVATWSVHPTFQWVQAPAPEQLVQLPNALAVRGRVCPEILDDGPLLRIPRRNVHGSGGVVNCKGIRHPPRVWDGSLFDVCLICADDDLTKAPQLPDAALAAELHHIRPVEHVQHRVGVHPSPASVPF
eukprot:scaffold1253_cov245-Pinguiococcus_pyrenoidosus.AAC.16